MEGSHAENVIAPLRQIQLSRYMKKNRAKVRKHLQTKKEDLLMKMKYFNAPIVPKHSIQNVISKDMKRSLVKKPEEVVFDPLLNQTVHLIH